MVMHSHCRRHARCHAAFTLVEILVVIAIIAILVSLVLVAAGRLLQQSKSTASKTNLRTIAQASTIYSTDNNGYLLSPRTTQLEGNDKAERYWIWDFGTDSQGQQRQDMESALKDGAAYEYIGEIGIYRSPIDPTERLRSYSLNGFIGVSTGANEDDTLKSDLENGQRSHWLTCNTKSQIPHPSETICVIAESGPGNESSSGNGNVDGWVINTNGTEWWRYPALWLDDGVNVAFLDGSMKTVRLDTSKTLREFWYSGSDVFDYAANPGVAKDYNRLKNMLFHGRITSLLASN